jgi:ABC-type polysaccharide/polyol phosphate export permease
MADLFLIFLKNFRVWRSLALFDMKQFYRRTVLGPIWYSLSTAIWTFAVTVVYGTLFSMPKGEYSAYILASMICWTWIATVISESGTLFISNAARMNSPDIKNEDIVFSAAVRYLMVFIYQLPMILVFLAIGKIPLSINIMFLFLSLPLFFLASIPVIYLVAVLCTRYRDLNRLISSSMVIILMVTPVFWKYEMLSGGKHFIADFNPLYHLLEILRAPLLGAKVSITSYLVVLGVTIFSYVIFVLLHRSYNKKIIFWI